MRKKNISMFIRKKTFGGIIKCFALILNLFHNYEYFTEMLINNYTHVVLHYISYFVCPVFLKKVNYCLADKSKEKNSELYTDVI